VQLLLVPERILEHDDRVVDHDPIAIVSASRVKLLIEKPGST